MVMVKSGNVFQSRTSQTGELVLSGASKLKRLTLELLNAVLADQNTSWGGGDMSASAYDTAWVAMVRNPYNHTQLAFPRSFHWLLRHQSADGSWGDKFPYTLVPTMAGLLALLKSPYQTETVRSGINRAKTYLHTNLPNWSVENYESIGFEIVVPGMLQQLERQGIIFNFPAKQQLIKLYNEKLLIAGPELLYSGQSNLIFSLEGFGASLDYQRLRGQQAPTGGYGASPSATAATLIYNPQWDAKAAHWLHCLSEHAFAGEHGAMPNAVIDMFEPAWVLYNLAWGGVDLQNDLPSNLLNGLVAWLKAGLDNEKGASYSRFSATPNDSDDTGMVLAALRMAGQEAPIDSLLQFERDNYFACFERERGASITANTHSLAALLSGSPEEMTKLASSISKIETYLYNKRQPDGYWTDKWHSSPYYATACAVLALAGHVKLASFNQLDITLDWVLNTQSENGGWGWHGETTLEETAYALQILQTLEPLILACGDIRKREKYYLAIEQGIAYLWEQLDNYYPAHSESLLPKLWLGKVLYNPSRVVLSAILAVLNRHLISAL